jgi:hypothetical protein
MNRKKGRRVFSLNYLFASFFGAVMIAGAFAYYNYKFSEFKFFNFKDNVFYTKNDIFIPSHEYYTIMIYSSNMSDREKLTHKIKTKYKILAIDLYQQRFKEENSTIYLTAGMNTLLKIVQNFNIYQVPVVFDIKKFNNVLYKQDSKKLHLE